MPSESSEGRCRCGALRFSLDAAPLLTFACHCTGCQRMTGSAFSLSTLYPSAAFSITAGEPVLGGLRGPTRHYFCPDCLSWLFTRPEGLDDYVNVRSTMLDDAAAPRPFIEAWTCEALPFVSTGAVHSFDTEPTEERLPELLAGFAAFARSSG